MSDQDPCQLNIEKFYPNKDPKDVKYSLKFLKGVREKLTTRGELRNFINDYSKQKGLELTSRMLSELDTIGKGAMNLDRLRHEKWNGDFLQAGLSLLEETSSVVKGAGVNAEASINIWKKHFYSAYDAEIQGTGFAKEFRTGAFDSEIRDVIKGKKYEGPNAEKINEIAKIVRKYYAIMNHELNSAGMRTYYRADYDGPMVHDGTTIFSKGFTEWAKSLDKALDFHKEFVEVATEDIRAFQEALKSGKELPEKWANETYKILKYSFENITKQDALHLDEMPRALERPVSIVDRRSYAKSFTTWRSGAHIQEYLTEFGKYKTVEEQMSYYSRSAARDIGLTSTLGASPGKGMGMLKDNVSLLMKRAGKTDFEINEAQVQLDRAYNNLVKPKTPDIGTIGKGSVLFRTTTAQAKLGMAGITSILMDPAATALQRRVLLNENIVSALFKSYFGTLMAMKDAFRGDVEAAFLHSSYDLHSTWEELMFQSGGQHRFGRPGAILQVTGNMIAKGSGAQFFNKVAHINNAKLYLGELARIVKTGKVTDVMLADLEKFHITTDDLQIIKDLDLGEGGMRNVFRLEAEDMQALRPELTIEEAGIELSSFKERMSMWLLEKIKKGAPQAGNREKRILHRGTQEGTIMGEISRFFTQFKMTQTKVFIDSTYGANRLIAHDKMQAGKGTAFDFDNKDHLYNMGALAATLTSMGAMNMLLNAVLSQDDKQIKRWQDADPTLLLEAMARGGAFNVVGDLLNFQADKSKAVQNVLATPALVGLVTPFTAAHEATVQGNPAKAILDIGKTYTPGSNLWFLKPFVEGMSEAAKKSGKSHGASGGGSLNL